jgi:cytochrome o ubiquinol oxidase subunit IV
MSAHVETGHDDHHAAGHHGDAPDHGSQKSYIIGFLLSVVLTAIPFWLVMSGVIKSNQTTAAIVLAFALVQIVVHMIYFLHMNGKSESGWTMMAMVFTIVVIVITMSGSMWVMYHMNANMMPMSLEDMKQMP